MGQEMSSNLRWFGVGVYCSVMCFNNFFACSILIFFSRDTIGPIRRIVVCFHGNKIIKSAIVFIYIFSE